MSRSEGDAGSGRTAGARPAVPLVSAARAVCDTYLAVFLRHPPLIAVVVATLFVALVYGNLNNMALPLSRVANAWSKSNVARLGLAALLALALLRDTERASV